MRVVCMEFEGVLADTTPHRVASLREALLADGLALDDETWMEHCHGLPVEAAVQAARIALHAPDDPVAVELARLRAEKSFTERISRGLLMQPGGLAMVQALRTQARLALVTRAARRDVDFVLTLAGIADAFTCLVTADDKVEGKPSPAPYVLALEKLARSAPVTAGDAVTFEDARPGVRAARAAGLRVIAIGPLPPHHAMEADAYYPTLAGLSFDAMRSLARGGRA
ncbi:MAG: HAD family phosphatase [Gemmatimonadetes bacterium]|nr:HAD family phosphatase [Gemmatimonadota bacterium]